MLKENMKKFRVGERSAKITGVISVATHVTYPEETGDGTYVVNYGASLCSPTDLYNRRFGYALAEDRLFDAPGAPYTGKFVTKKLSHNEVMMKVMLSLALDPHVPSWAVPVIYEVIREGVYYCGL